jgi:pumilio family protein 6
MASTENKRKGPDSPKFSKKAKHDSGNSSSSKRQVKNERQSTRRHADVVVRAKEIWNKLRLKNNTRETTRTLMDELMPLIRGKMNQIALQHDAARVVQSAIQFGTKEERQEIVKELTATPGGLAELAKSQYAHFCVLKLIKYCHTDEVSTKLILQNLRTHFASLAVHAVASRVVESLWITYNEKKIAPLRYELYGPHFGLFVSDAAASPKSLTQLLNDDPSKKERTLEFVLKLLQKGMEKSLYGFSYFQDIMAEYCDNSTGGDIRKNLCSAASDHAIHLLAGRAGTRVAALLASYSTPKDRKAMLKSLKGYALSGLLHRDAYLAIIRLVQVTDDTRTVGKYVLDELTKDHGTKTDEDDEGKEENQHPLLQLLLSDTGSKFLLMQLTNNSDRKFLDPYEKSILGQDTPLIKGEDGTTEPTSKKDPDLRRTQVLDQIKESLVHVCTENSKELLESRSGMNVLRQVYSLERPKKLVDSLIAACQDKDRDTNIFEDPLGHLAVKQLLQEDAKSEQKIFATAFATSFETKMELIAESNRGAFVLEALCKAGMKQTVQKHVKKKMLEKLSKTDGPKAGFQALLKELS